MDRPSSEAVVAGTRTFAIALLAPVAARLGIRPRVAGDAAQALALCPGPGGAAVIEYAGEGALPGLERLVHAGVRVVVAVPPEHLAAEAAIRALGAEPVRWDGRPERVVEALAADPSGAAPGGSPIPVVGPPPGGQGGGAAGAPPRAEASLGDLEPRAAPAAVDAAPAAAQALRSSPTPLPLAGGQAAAWPAAAPGPAEAAGALARALAGALPPGDSLGAVAEQVVAGLSALEREVLAGDPQPFEVGPVRTAAVMRLRVAAALASAPPPGGPVDGGALQGMLGEIDALLADVKVLLSEAPDEARPGLEAVRNALVREAIAFSEAATGRGAAGVPAATPPPAVPAPARSGPAARPLPAAARTVRRRPTALVLLLALSAAGALGYHAFRLFARPAPTPPATFPGAPAGTFGVDRGASRLLMTLPGARVDPAELEQFGHLEAAKGNSLRAVAPGTWLIERAAPAAPGQEARP